jgi:phenylalanine-4-hydroxylase
LAEEKVLLLQNTNGEMSEMSQIRNLHWWTVEYGLIGEIDAPKIYGAGLLSSIGESINCLTDKVKKIPYSKEAANMPFDITTQQPQLYVTPDFTHLTIVLNEFADSMALRKGGPESVRKAIESNANATVELSSGLQISGLITNMIEDESGKVSYLQTTGPTMLCERERVMIGHGFSSHADGFGSPVGKLKGVDKAMENMTLRELASHGIITRKHCKLEFESGVNVEGKLHYIRKNKYGKVLLMSFKNCTVWLNGQKLFNPEWGIYDMAVGEKVVSVFAGLADKDAAHQPSYISPTCTHCDENVDHQLMSYYQVVRNIRQGEESASILNKTYKKLLIDYPKDWLISLEIFELALKLGREKIRDVVKHDLIEKTRLQPQHSKLILDGIRIAEAELNIKE